jgi:hypothetical protein
MSRFARPAAVLFTLFAAIALPANAAMAYVAPPIPHRSGGVPATPVLVTHVSSGLGAWAVFGIAVAAVAIGAALAEIVRSLSSRRHAHKLATA